MKQIRPERAATTLNNNAMFSLSNTSLNGVRNTVREAALSDFEFYSVNVLGHRFDEMLCDDAIEAVEQRRDGLFVIPRTHKYQFATALSGWLTLQGVHVLGTQPPQQVEMLAWLELAAQPTTAESGDAIASIDILPNGVSLQWL